VVDCNVCVGTVFVVWWQDAYLQDYHEGMTSCVTFVVLEPCQILLSLIISFGFYVFYSVLKHFCPRLKELVLKWLTTLSHDSQFRQFVDELIGLSVVNIEYWCMLSSSWPV